MSKFLFSHWWKSNTVSLHSIKNTGKANIRTLEVKIPHVSNFHDLHFKTPFHVGSVHAVWLYGKQGISTLVECKESWLFLVLSIKPAASWFWFLKLIPSRIHAVSFPSDLSELVYQNLPRRFQKLRVGEIIFIICHTRHSTHSQKLLFPWPSSEVGWLIIIYEKENHFIANK